MNIKVKKGFDINLAGKAEKTLTKLMPTTVALKPDDFVGMYRPKIAAKEGTSVKAGSPVLYDKAHPDIFYTSPVSGEVVEIRRGEKRKILEIVILAESETSYEEFKAYNQSELSKISADEIRATLLKSGAWTHILQRPYNVVPAADSTPKAIFISAFDSHPLAPDYNFAFKGEEKNMQAGISVLAKMAGCPIHVTTDAKAEVSDTFKGLEGVQKHQASGPHPAGNVGIHIHHVNPINKGEVVWTINPFGVALIGKLFLTGKYDAMKKVALTGSELNKPQYVEMPLGANLEKALEGQFKQDNVRVISGNPLTGVRIQKDGFLGYYDNQITVLPEGDEARFFLTTGWLAPVANRVSFHKAFGLLSFLNGKKKEYRLDTSMNGEERAFVLTGEFERVTPMDVLPTHLIKAILSEDYDEMEALGIYEVVEEDLALCEFIDVSKHPIQEILREGLDMMRATEA
ncbi:MAG: Na(+)-translocating NADH-quinone reductase subunit A [Bacteroidota bacterium]